MSQGAVVPHLQWSAKRLLNSTSGVASFFNPILTAFGTTGFSSLIICPTVDSTHHALVSLTDPSVESLRAVPSPSQMSLHINSHPTVFEFLHYQPPPPPPIISLQFFYVFKIVLDR
ncbi:hypothetical protein A0H81_10728 [Grifola frondosa]|uniref:Uncharacterized protein n=1 Tax=Grifola frondosa TaxID=5627 RepID=A0A1C7LWT3_GRIFR|nr:hypothetical protein A0H81_10728 [Grifola frondosa]